VVGSARRDISLFLAPSPPLSRCFFYKTPYDRCNFRSTLARIQKLWQTSGNGAHGAAGHQPTRLPIPQCTRLVVRHPLPPRVLIPHHQPPRLAIPWLQLARRNGPHLPKRPPHHGEASDRTLRICSIPLSVTRDESKSCMKEFLGCDGFELSLVPSESYQVATVTFTATEPAQLVRCTWR